MMIGPVLQELQQGASTLSDDGATADILDTIPEELDKEKFDRGRQFFINNLAGCCKGMFYSLVVGLSVKSLLDVLVVTGETSDPVKSFKRYLYTALNVAKWHYGNIWDEYSKARKSILSVRKKHFMARKLVEDVNRRINHGQNDRFSGVSTDSLGPKQRNRKYPSRDFSTLSDKSSVCISQYDMSLVQTGFIVFIVLYPHRCGIKCTKTELDDFIYVWRWIGYLLGINDRNNICIGGFERAYTICKAIEFEIILPSLANPPEQFKPMANAFLDGIEMASRGFMTPKLKPIVAFAFKASGSPIPFEVSIMDRIHILMDYVMSYAMYYIPGVSYLLNVALEKVFYLRNMT